MRSMLKMKSAYLSGCGHDASAGIWVGSWLARGLIGWLCRIRGNGSAERYVVWIALEAIAASSNCSTVITLVSRPVIRARLNLLVSL